MHDSIAKGEVITLDHIDSFVDGAAVRRVGKNNFPIVKAVMEGILLVPEGQVCMTMLELYNEDGLGGRTSWHPCGSGPSTNLTTSKARPWWCVISGGNNDITRTAEIQERALLFAGLKHYFIVEFPQRAGALHDFLNLLGPEDDITHFEYTKKHNRAVGPALVGIQLKKSEDLKALLTRMDEGGIQYQAINDQPMLFEMFV